MSEERRQELSERAKELLVISAREYRAKNDQKDTLILLG